MRLLSAYISKLRREPTPPNPSALSEYWHPAQFCNLYDSDTRQTHVAMLIAVPDPLFDREDLNPGRLSALLCELRRFGESQWASLEAARAANFITSTTPTRFVGILEHAPIGSYATRTQQIKAHYGFENDTVGALMSKGMRFCDDRLSETFLL